MDSEHPSKAIFASFLLAQVGAHAARQFAECLFPLKLTPPHAGILRRLAQSSGISQRELAAQLGMHASRLVGVVDEMESLGLVIREGNTDDRRTYSLQITPKGRETLKEIGKISHQHNEALLAALTPEERETLANLLQRIADQQGLTRGVHPGYSSLSGKTRRPSATSESETKETSNID
jgi:DNA-binding MarR family transcriptional regulator